MDRRRFIVSSAGAALFSWVTPRALAVPITGDLADRILVTVCLTGGNDGLNTVVPWTDDGYARQRSSLRLDKADLIPVDEDTGLHGSLSWIGKRIEERRATVVRGVGYPRPDRSHFKSMDIWLSGRRDDEARDGTGWIGRALDRCKDNAAALHVGEGVPSVALRGTRSAPLSMAGPEDLALYASAPRWVPSGEPAETALEGFANLRYRQALAFARKLQDLSDAGSKTNAYPANTIGQGLRTIAVMLRLGVPNRVFSTHQDGYDTHSNQKPTHAALLRALDRSLEAFWKDVESIGLANRLLIMVFSEFGRTLSENASGGTDHGTAGPVFLIGPRTKMPLEGMAPSLTVLDDGEPTATVDYRRIYAAVLEKWLRLAPRPVIGRGFEPIDCLG